MINLNNIWYNYFPIQLRNIIKTFYHKSIESIKYFNNFVYPIQILKKNAILIYTMEKTSSTSLFYSLKSLGFNNLYRYHYFNPSNRNKYVLNHLHFVQECNPKWKWNRFYYGYWIYKNIILKEKPLKVITLIRNPFNRSMSKFFHSYPIYNQFNLSNYSLTEVYDIFFKSTIFNDTINYFDNELKQTLQIDVYDYRFCKELGYRIIKKNNIELLILKCELNNKEKERIIKQFLNLKSFKIDDYNINKNINNVYDLFKKNIKFPKEIKEKVLQSKYYTHFY